MVYPVKGYQGRKFSQMASDSFRLELIFLEYVDCARKKRYREKRLPKKDGQYVRKYPGVAKRRILGNHPVRNDQVGQGSKKGHRKHERAEHRGLEP